MHKFSEIVVTVTSVDDPAKTQFVTTLQGYIGKYHHDSVESLQYIVSLLSFGKIRITSENRTDRLQLANKKDLVSRDVALAILEEYLLTLDKCMVARFAVDATQKIFLHTPIQR